MSKKPEPQNEAELEDVSNMDAHPENHTEGKQPLRYAEKVEELEKELEAAHAKAEDNWEKALRAVAELENIKKRAEKDVANAHKFAIEKFAKGLLPVMDSLEQALALEVEAEQEQIQAMRKGIELTVEMFVSTMEKFGLEQLDPVDEGFDPEHHEAMSMIEVPDKESNTVVQVIQRGYKLNGRVVRPARVIVAK